MVRFRCGICGRFTKSEDIHDVYGNYYCCETCWEMKVIPQAWLQCQLSDRHEGL